MPLAERQASGARRLGRVPLEARVMPFLRSPLEFEFLVI